MCVRYESIIRRIVLCGMVLLLFTCILICLKHKQGEIGASALLGRVVPSGVKGCSMFLLWETV